VISVRRIKTEVKGVQLHVGPKIQNAAVAMNTGININPGSILSPSAKLPVFYIFVL